MNFDQFANWTPLPWKAKNPPFPQNGTLTDLYAEIADKMAIEDLKTWVQAQEEIELKAVKGFTIERAGAAFEEWWFDVYNDKAAAKEALYYALNQMKKVHYVLSFSSVDAGALERMVEFWDPDT